MSQADHAAMFESLGAYALGALHDDERAAVSAHIESCPICAEDAAAFQRAATRLTDTVPILEPGPHVRDRIMAVVESEAALMRSAAGERPEVRAPRRSLASWLAPGSGRWAAAGATLLVVGAILGAVLPGTGGSSTRTLDAAVGHGHAWVEVKNGNAQLVVENLPAPPGRKVYEVWVQHGAEPPQPASRKLSDAIFVVSSGRVEIPARIGSGDRIMVTAEPAGGSQQPTSLPVVITTRA